MQVYCVALLTGAMEMMEFEFIDYNLKTIGYFSQRPISEYFKFSCRTIAQSTHNDVKTTTKLNSELIKTSIIVYSFRHVDKTCVLIATDNVSSSLAFLTIFKILKSPTPHEEIKMVINGSLNNDKIYKINEEIKSVQEIMHKNIEAVIARGETLDSLVKKSKDLSDHSKKFYVQSNKFNKCCKAF